jgi:hypothetical protein
MVMVMVVMMVVMMVKTPQQQLRNAEKRDVCELASQSGFPALQFIAWILSVSYYFGNQLSGTE